MQFEYLGTCTHAIVWMETSSSFKLWLCFPAGEPGLGARPAETDGVWTEPHDAGCHAHPGGPTSETAPPSGGGEAQIPKPGGAAHPTAAVSLILSKKHSKQSGGLGWFGEVNDSWCFQLFTQSVDSVSWYV